MRESNNDTHQTEEAFGVPQDQLRGIISSVNEGYKTFCKQKTNVLGKKCDRRHMMPNSERLYNQNFANPNKTD